MIAIKRILLPRDTNHRGEIFGGAILAEIDLAGAVEARKHTEHDVATVAVKEVEFKKPVKVGDVVTFHTSLVRIGNTSIHVRVEVEASRDGQKDTISVTAAEVVYVTVAQDIENNLRPIPVEMPYKEWLARMERRTEAIKRHELTMAMTREGDTCPGCGKGTIQSAPLTHPDEGSATGCDKCRWPDRKCPKCGGLVQNHDGFIMEDDGTTTPMVGCIECSWTNSPKSKGHLAHNFRKA